VAEEPNDPLKNFFAQFSGGQMPDMNQIMAQMQRMFAPHEGPVNFELAKDVARHALAAAGPDPAPSAHQGGAVSDAVRLAESWLDQATSLRMATTSSAAWSRAEWIEHTADSWQILIEPIAEHVIRAMGDALPEELQKLAGPLVGMLSQAGGAMFGQQIGQALAELAREVVSSTDAGLPLGPAGLAAILPDGVDAFGKDLGQGAADVLLYIVLRECATHRLHHAAPWLRPAILEAVAEFGRGTRIDVSAIEEKLGSIDPSRPEAIQEALGSGLFAPQTTSEQATALARLEHLLALSEGWVEEVVAQATAERMPAAAALGEAMRRRRATGGPAERTFASLVGLELRPRRLRDAANLWAAVRDLRGADLRDRIWSHPDLMPRTEDLDDPLGFAEASFASTDDDMDVELGKLLDDE
jgi:putative hydrolase